MRELAIRFSLGAGRLRLGRQLLTESVALALVGGALGIAVGTAGLRLLAYLGAKDLPRGAGIALDGKALAFTAVVALATGLVFGSVPVIHLFRRNLSDVFRNTERAGTAHAHALWTRSALVVCQVSLAFVLLIGAGLLTASFWRLLNVNPGFRPEHVLTARFSLPRVRYQQDSRARSFISNLLENVRAIPGVRQAGATTFLPFGGNLNSSVIMIEGYVRAPGENPPVPGWNMVDPGYFQALGIPLLRGRAFTAGDTEDSPRVAIIDDYLARRYWPKGNPIGAAFKRGVDGTDKPWTIVGVAGSVKTGDLAEQNPVGHLYFPYKQFVPRAMHLVVKTDRDDRRVMAALRRELQRADPELALFDVKTMPERLSASLGARRAAMVLCLIFAGLALLLSAIGIYGVLAYAVAQRTREFGIRVALGAGAAEVLRMVAGQGLKLAAIGLAVGLAGALALTRLIASLLYSVRPTDPVVFVCVAAALALVTLIASLVPSLRALRIRPAVALRYE